MWQKDTLRVLVEKLCAYRLLRFRLREEMEGEPVSN